jgi:nitrate/nitrite transporter NarK
VGGLLVGLGGATFAIGIPFVNAWVPPERRGLALGIYGMGNGGTAMSGFVSPSLAEAFGLSARFIAVAAALAVVASLREAHRAATVGFLTIAAAMGVGNGAVFALVGRRRAPAGQVGSVTGLVGAAGGLGGFMPPIAMGLVFQVTGCRPTAAAGDTG